MIKTLCMLSILWGLFVNSCIAKIELPWFADLYIEDSVSGQEPSIYIERVKLELLFAHLQDEYAIELNSLPPDRSVKNLTLLPLSCVSNLIKTPERLAISHYSSPFSLSISPHFVYWKDDTELHGVMSEFTEGVEISKLVQRYPKTQIGLSSGRSYGAIVDDVIKDSSIAPYVYWRNGQDKTTGVINMFMKHRFNVIIEYPVVINKYLQDQNITDSVGMLPIANTLPYVTGYIACSKNPLGQMAIVKINQALEQLKSDPAFYSALSHPFLGSSEEVYRNAYAEIFGVLPNRSSNKD